jgi:hypothetical protein
MFHLNCFKQKQRLRRDWDFEMDFTLLDSSLDGLKKVNLWLLICLQGLNSAAVTLLDYILL